MVLDKWEADIMYDCVIKQFAFAFILLIICSLPTHAGTILIIGDSLSAGYGIPPEKGWVVLLQKRLSEQGYDYTVVNDSISGDTTSNGLQRLSKSLNQHNPDITLIELGGNDGLRGISPGVIQQNLTNMIRVIQKSQSKALLVGVVLPPNYGRAYLMRFIDVYRKVAAQQDIPLVADILKGVGGDPTLMQKDRVHPTLKAQQKLLDNVWPTLRKML